jgi:multiple sugar transport system permease protein
MATILSRVRTGTVEPVIESRPRGRGARVASLIALVVGAIVFLFPFWYMLVGALQKAPDSSLAGAFPSPTTFTLDNLRSIDSAIDLKRALFSSGVFTGGVIVMTLLLGLPAGYALAQLSFRGRDTFFSVVILLLVVPFMLLMIPLYVMIVRWYGLADNYLGIILPFAVNPTAVFIFRQFFRQIPSSLFESARLDGGSEAQVLTRVAVPLARPAILTAVLVTFIGPWNEFLWPFLVTKDPAKQPLAVALASYIDNVAATAANPFGAILAGALVLAIPAIVLFVVFQRRFADAQLGAGVKG